MIRQRFPSGRLFRIGTWTVAAVTGSVAFLSGQDAQSNTTPTPDPDPTAIIQTSPVGTALPEAPASGLLVLRVEPTPPPPPPTILREVVVADGSGSPAARASTAATPATPPPPPPLSAAPAPVQSAGS